MIKEATMLNVWVWRSLSLVAHYDLRAAIIGPYVYLYPDMHLNLQP